MTEFRNLNINCRPEEVSPSSRMTIRRAHPAGKNSGDICQPGEDSESRGKRLRSTGFFMACAASVRARPAGRSSGDTCQPGV